VGWHFDDDDDNDDGAVIYYTTIFLMQLVNYENGFKNLAIR